MNQHLHRRGDGDTSAMAAASVDTSLSENHKRALAALVAVCPATDLEMAVALSGLGFGREEACRRLVRTLREEHGRLVPACDPRTGVQIRHLNPTGRWAEAWIPGYAPPPERREVDTIVARVGRCRQVDVDGVEHVRFDGRQFYLAADFLDALQGYVDEPKETLF